MAHSSRTRRPSAAQLYRSGPHRLQKAGVVLHQQEGAGVVPQKGLQLHPGKHVHIVQRLVPDVQMGALAQAPGQQDLFLLSGAVAAHILLQLGAGEVQLAQDGLKEGLVNPGGRSECRQIPLQAGGVLGHIGDVQAGGQPQYAPMGDVLPAHQL